jgi:hypothetical protein
MNSLKTTLISLLRAFIDLVKAEPGQQAELEALKAKVADLQEQLAGSLPLDDEFRAVVAEAAEAAAAATPAPAPVVEAPAPTPAVEEPAPTPEAEAPVVGDVVPPVDVPAAAPVEEAPAAEPQDGGEPTPASVEKPE